MVPRPEVRYFWYPCGSLGGFVVIYYFIQHVSQFRRLHFLTIGLSLIPLPNSGHVPNQATASDLPFYDSYVLKMFLFRKFLMTTLHVICGLGLWASPLNQNSWIRP